MNIRHCLVVLGLVVRWLEGSIITFSQTKVSGQTTFTIINTFNLTTASKTEATSLLKRIDLRKADYNVKPTTDIFLRNNARDSRRYSERIGDLWRWDFWCMLQPETGNCGRNRTKYDDRVCCRNKARYYYNTQVDQCLPHVFSGCSTKNNKNQFESIEECNNHCKGSALMPVNLPPNTDICKLQPVSGRCLGYIKRFYYDVNEAQCKSFVYGGCAGNENRFESVLPCLNRCHKKYIPEYDYEVGTGNAQS